ncbi:MAG: response regulator [Campylobacterales bacterium]
MLQESDKENLEKLTILFAEDEDISRDAVERILKKRVKEVYAAKNGEEALEIYKNRDDIDVLITDIEMPKLNGIELIDKIKELSPKTPAVVITAFSDEIHKSPKADYHLTKPLNKNQLLEILALIGSKK